ncbi:MAG TPA: DUF362 domain-containing protein [Bryobacteraceae bacterium]|nr:DUF362 domain-containing protein [Bryobacteraceae bacterium]
MKLDRRRFVRCAAGTVTTTALAAEWVWPKHSISYRKPRSFVAVLEANEYSENIEELLFDGLRLFHLNVSNKSVLLKPNLVEDLPGPVNTNSVLVGAAARCFLRLGAGRVVIGEGPGHQRDTDLVVEAAGLKPHLNERQIQFVDLNRDELMKVNLTASYSGLRALWLPRTVLASDFAVSMPKIKTHHWAGVTLSLKNMFGVVPGLKYGWPKNLLHWHSIHESILDICATTRIHFVIADGIRAMGRRWAACGNRATAQPGRIGGRPSCSGRDMRAVDGFSSRTRSPRRGSRTIAGESRNGSDCHVS